MSLQTDIIFVKAIKSDASLLSKLAAGDVYNTTIAMPDEDLDNAPLPYCIISYDGMQNDESTKDSYEGSTDMVNISIEVAARTRPELADLMKHIRQTVRNYFTNIEESDEDYSLVPYDYQLTADAVQYDALKPCYWQTLKDQCDTKVDEDE